MNYPYKLNQSGVALLITMLLLGTIMATALGISVLVRGEIGITRLVDDSVFAIFAADAGLEKMLYACSGKISYPPSANFTSSDLGNGSSYHVYMADEAGVQTNDCNDLKIISNGIFGSTERTFEARYQ